MADPWRLLDLRLSTGVLLRHALGRPTGSAQESIAIPPSGQPCLMRHQKRDPRAAWTVLSRPLAIHPRDPGSFSASTRQSEEALRMLPRGEQVFHPRFGAS